MRLLPHPLAARQGGAKVRPRKSAADVVTHLRPGAVWIPEEGGCKQFIERGRRQCREYADEHISRAFTVGYSPRGSTTPFTGKRRLFGRIALGKIKGNDISRTATEITGVGGDRLPPVSEICFDTAALGCPFPRRGASPGVEHNAGPDEAEKQRGP